MHRDLGEILIKVSGRSDRDEKFPKKKKKAARNVLIRENLQCVICDMGLSRQLDERDETRLTVANFGPLKHM